MNDLARSRERVLWITVVAVLATSMTWLAAVAAVVTVQSHSPALAPTFAVLHAMTRVAIALYVRALPLLSLTLVGGMMLAFTVRRRSIRSRGARHV
jgi:hypothetical protein